LSGFDLTGRVAIVTGGSQGIGKGIALAFAEAGADVAIVARESERVTGGSTRIHQPARPVVDQIQAMGRNAIGILADVRDAEQIDEMAARVRRELGRIDILVNNAGATWGETFKTGPLLELTPGDFEECLRLNLHSVFLCSRAVVPTMLEQGKGVIVNLASQSGRGPSPNQGAYGAAKAGVVSLTQTMSLEWAPQVRVNAVAPGYIQHPDRAAVHPYAPPPETRLQGTVALDRAGTVDDITGAILYLASDASAYTTGAVIDIDGGRRSW
jgi:NAD(P)-dependent dehydrogenase (short-subunit alcohol dehydrogenase family)